MNSNTDHLYEPMLRYARKNFPIIRDNLNVGEGLSIIRREGAGERIIYFYVINDDGQLVGIIPTSSRNTVFTTTKIEVFCLV